jgi:DNA-binding SARP family transcriptional activator/tetratricopeptide (TPR) repeat protein
MNISDQPLLRIQLFGQFQVSVGERALPILSKKARSLLAYGALRPGHPISRDELMAALWPNSDEYIARPRLRKMIWKLRSLLHSAEPSLTIRTTQSTLSVECAADAVDAVKFERLATSSGGDQSVLREAVDLYRGDLLPDMDDEWIENRRFHLQAMFLRTIKRFLGQLVAQGTGTVALAYARRAVDVDRTDEEIAYIFMQAAVLAGEASVALAQYDVLTRALIGDMGISPSARITELFDRIRTTISSEQSSEKVVGLGIPPVDSSLLTEASTLSGRSVECQRLLNAMNRARSGHSAAIVITGPAGMGKTCLADALIVEARLAGMPAYKGRCSHVPNPPPYHPIVEALWAEISKSSVEHAPVLSSLLSTLVPTKRKARRRSTGTIATLDSALINESLLRALPAADDLPILLVFDDVHRADHATWAWLNCLLLRLADFRLCFVLTARTGETEDQNQRVAHLAVSGAEILALDPLDEESVKALISATLDAPQVPSNLWRKIVRHVGGNPLEILEAIRLLKERGLLRRSGETWILDSQVSEVLTMRAASRIKTLIKQRIALLPGTTRDVLSAAAVLGMEMSPEHLRRLLKLPERRFLSHLDRLIWHRLLLTRGSTIVRFSHEEIRNVVLEQITLVRRRWLHARAARLLSQAQSAKPEDLYWHYHGAGYLNEALSAATDAGDRSYMVGEHEAAVAWYERALASLDPDVSNPRIRLTLQLKLEAALNQHGDRLGQLRALESAEEIATSGSCHEEICEVLIRRSLCLTRVNRRDAAIESAHLAAEYAQKRSDLYREARAYRAMGTAHENFGDAEAVTFLDKAMKLFRQVGAKTDESLTLSELATAYDRLGNHKLAIYALDRAAGSIPSDHPSRAFLLARRAGAFLWTGRLSETYAAVQESLPLVRRYGDRVGEGRALRVLADAHTIAGRYRDALAADGRGLQIAKQAADVRLVAGILNSLIGGVYSRLGLTHRARAAFDHLMLLVGDDPQEWYRALGEDSLSIVYLQVGDWKEARLWAERALKTGAAIGREWYASAEAHLHLGHALLELKDPAGAKEHILASLAYHRLSGELPYQAFETALLAVAAADLGTPAEAEAYVRESMRLLHRIDVLQDAHLLHWLHGYVWSRLGSTRQAARAFRAAYSELNRVAASLGGPLRRRFLGLPFNRRIIDSVAPAQARIHQPLTQPAGSPNPPPANGLRSDSYRAEVRRKAILKLLRESPRRPTRGSLAATFGVAPRTITHDIAMLRRAGHEIDSPRAD